MFQFSRPETESKEFELRLTAELKFVWFHLKLYSMFQDLSRHAQLKPVYDGFKTRLKFIKFGHRSTLTCRTRNTLTFRVLILA